MQTNSIKISNFLNQSEFFTAETKEFRGAIRLIKCLGVGVETEVFVAKIDNLDQIVAFK